MADVKISGLPASTVPLAGTEVLPIVQGGQTRQVSVNNLTTGKSVSATQFVSTVATGTAPLTVSSTTEVANLRAANATSADTANQVKSNATTGVLQVAGPATGTTRVMTTPDANFTVARIDAAQSFTGDQTLSTGNLVIGTSGKGIDFSATSEGTGTMTSELLDDYEEGTFTPTVVGATSAGTATYTEQAGYYTKVGNRVLANLSVIWSGHTGTGAMRISGLPFTNENATNNFAIPSFYVSDITLTASNLLQGFVNTNGAQVLLYQYAVGGGSAATVAVDAAGTIRLSLQYQTAS